MIYAFSIDTPLNTTKLDPVKTLLTLEKGVLTSLEVNFPPGSAGLLSAVLFREGYQIFPKSTGDFHGDDRTFRYPRIAFPLLFEPYELYAHTWNTDDTFDHIVDIYIVIEELGVIV